MRPQSEQVEHDSHQLMYLLWIAVAVMAAMHITILILPKWTGLFVGGILGIGSSLLTGVFALAAANKYDKSNRLTLRLIGIGQIIYTVGFAGVYYNYTVAHLETPVGTPTDIFSAIGLFIQIFGFVRLIPKPENKTKLFMAVLDGFIVASSFFVLVWLLIVRSAASTAAGEAAASSAIGMVVYDSFLIVALFLAISGEPRGNTIPLLAKTYLGVGMLVVAIADLAVAHYIATESTKKSIGFTPVFSDAFILMLLAMVITYKYPNIQSKGPSKTLRDFGTTYLVFTFAAVTIPVIVMQGSTVDTVTIACVMSMFVALVGRQFLVLRDNVALNHDLEARVEERTEQLRQSSMKLAASEERFRSLVQQSSDVVIIVDEHLRITYVSPAAKNVFRFYPDGWLDESILEICSHELRVSLRDAILLASSTPGLSNTVEWELVRGNGVPLRVESSISDLRDQPSVGGFVLNTRDVSERFALEQRLRHQASHDALTGLANRTLFRANVLQAADRVRDTNDEFSLLFCDLDGFKSVNDSQGHQIGDELLIDVSGRISAIVGDGGVVARLGGDEFGVVTAAGMSTEQIETMAQQIIAGINTPFVIRGADVSLGISIGIASSALSYEDIDDLMAKADLAMYLAKSSGKNKCMRFVPTMHDNLVRQLHLEDDLRRALERDQITVRYQPIYDLHSGRPVAAEALARWVHPELGVIPPSEFIPVAEDTGLINEIGKWILEQSCHVASNLFANYGTSEFRISVNVSGRQFRDGNFVDEVVEILRKTGANASNLVLEVTESMFLASDPAVSDQIHSLREMGIHVAVDDFGTGYSSLSSIKSFDVDYLKIDRAFVSGMNEDSGHDLVRAIIRMGESMSLTVVAEGIETQEELHTLQGMGCQFGQGFLFSEPVPALALASELSGRKDMGYKASK